MHWIAQMAAETAGCGGWDDSLDQGALTASHRAHLTGLDAVRDAAWEEQDDIPGQGKLNHHIQAVRNPEAHEDTDGSKLAGPSNPGGVVRDASWCCAAPRNRTHAGTGPVYGRRGSSSVPLRRHWLETRWVHE